MNKVEEFEGGWKCSCGAQCSAKERGRFLKRHPAACERALGIKEDKIAFSKQLAQGVKSVGVGDEGAERLLERVRERSDLTRWEREVFIPGCEKQWEEKQWLSDFQLKILMRIEKGV